MCSSKRMEDLDITREELDKIGEALKDKEFRKLFAEYIEEITDPENQKLYEKEITQLEKERGVDVVFVHPKPGYVIKTSVGGEKKAFINICYNDLMKTPKYELTELDNKRGTSWSIPYSMSEPRDDYDKKYKRVIVYDVVFHSSTLDFASKNEKFKQIVNETACDAVENNFKVQLDRKNLKFPKLKYKGTPQATVIRKDIPGATPNPEDVEFYEKIYPSKTKHQKAKEQPKMSPCVKLPKPDETSYTVPKYCIKHRHGIDLHEFTENQNAKLLVTVPSHLVIEVQLPLLQSAGTINLDVTEKTICLVSDIPSKYKLNLTLPYPVKEDEGDAKFDKDLHRLVITLPVQVDNFIFKIDKEKEESISLLEDIDANYNSDPKQDASNEVIEKPKIIETLELHNEEDVVPEIIPEDNINFFNHGISYTFPKFNSSLSKNIVKLSLDIKNVIPESLILKNYNDRLLFKCSSIGSGYFTVHYGFCFEIQSSIQDVKTDVWNNKVTIDILLLGNGIPKYYNLGVDEEHLSQCDMPEEEISDSSEDSTDTDSDDSIIDSPSILKTAVDYSDALENDEDVCVNNKSTLKEICDEDSIGTEISANPAPKSILKTDSDMEEAIDESKLCKIKVLYDEPAKDDELSLRDVKEQPAIGTRKIVKFKETVSKTVYRSNSSILGQRNKNQRKKRNKKRALERKKAEYLDKETRATIDFINENESLKGLPFSEANEENKRPKDLIKFESDIILKIDM